MGDHGPIESGGSFHREKASTRTHPFVVKVEPLGCRLGILDEVLVVAHNDLSEVVPALELVQNEVDGYLCIGWWGLGWVR